MKKNVILVFCIVWLANAIVLASADTQNLQYDANGNLVTGDGLYRIYDGFNHLVQIRNGNNASASILMNYTWHPLEERLFAKSVYEPDSSWKETVYYLSKEYIIVYNASGDFHYKYIYQNEELVAFQNYDGKKYFIHGDNLGSVSVITDENGTVVEQTFYEPFGKIISGSAASRYSYTGKEYDSVTGDYDFNARRMNPDLARFVTPDPIIQNPYEPQDLNHYSYVRNNPYKYIDPTGKDAVIANYNIGGGSSGYDFGHSSLVVGSNEEGWNAYWFGTDEPEVYEGGVGSILKETRGQVITGSGSTWQEALTSIEEKGAGQHNRKNVAYFKADTAQNNAMKAQITKAYETQKESKYSPLWNNCGQSAANILQSGGINTNKAALPNVYLSQAKVDAKVNNAKVEAKSSVVKLIKSITNVFKRSKK